MTERPRASAAVPDSVDGTARCVRACGEHQPANDVRVSAHPDADYYRFGDVTLRAWRSQGELVRLLGREIFVVDTGEEDRPAILLIHGLPTSSWDWVPIWDALHEQHRLVALDLLGFGFSDKPDPHAYSIHEQADICEALVTSRELDELHVIAHDYGDTVAQELLARQNEGMGAGRWRSLLLLNGGLFPETHQPRPIQRLLLSPVGPLITRLSSKRTLDRSLRRIFGPESQPSPDLVDGYWELLNFGGKRAPLHRLITYMTDRKTHRQRWVSALRESVVPVGLINGSVDPVSGAHMIARYREIVRSDDFIVELPTIGHFPQVEAPKRFVEAYAEFLETARKAR